MHFWRIYVENLRTFGAFLSRKRFTRSVRKVFAREILPTGKFGLFGSLAQVLIENRVTWGCELLATFQFPNVTNLNMYANIAKMTPKWQTANMSSGFTNAWWYTPLGGQTKKPRLFERNPSSVLLLVKNSPPRLLVFKIQFPSFCFLALHCKAV